MFRRLAVTAASSPHEDEATLLAASRADLESLPAEILETVLLYSADLALPRASPRLGVKLSDRVTLLRLFIWAFHDTWDQWFGIPRRFAYYYFTREFSIRIDEFQGDPVLQSAILELPWVDIDFILQAQQAWSRRYARGRCYQHSVPVSRSGDGPELADDHGSGFGNFDARACFEADYQQALTMRARYDGLNKWRASDVHPRTRMPARLLTGPWDDEKLRRLFWLTRAGIHMNDYMPWEVRLQSLDNAVISAPEPSALVVNCIMGSWTFADVPRDAVTRARAKIDKRMKWEGASRESRLVLFWALNKLHT